MINIWYIYDDATALWIGDNDKVRSWTDAKEFHDEDTAREYADENSYVCFGWVQ